MTWPILTAFIVAITGLIGALWGIIKYYDIKREKKSKQHYVTMEHIVTDAIAPIQDTNNKQQESLEELDININEVKEHTSELKENILTINNRLDLQQEEIRLNELSRLQTSIMDFATLLRNGNDVNLNSFNYIYHAYDQYKSLGGNSFVDSEMQYIKERKRELEAFDNNKK